MELPLRGLGIDRVRTPRFRFCSSKSALGDQESDFFGLTLAPAAPGDPPVSGFLRPRPSGRHDVEHHESTGSVGSTGFSG